MTAVFISGYEYCQLHKFLPMRFFFIKARITICILFTTNAPTGGGRGLIPDVPFHIYICNKVNTCWDVCSTILGCVVSSLTDLISELHKAEVVWAVINDLCDDISEISRDGPNVGTQTDTKQTGFGLMLKEETRWCFLSISKYTVFKLNSFVLLKCWHGFIWATSSERKSGATFS